jgi:hypothetical protein
MNSESQTIGSTTRPCDTFTWCAGHGDGAGWEDDVDNAKRAHLLPIGTYVDSEGVVQRVEFEVLESMLHKTGERFLEGKSVWVGPTATDVEGATAIAHQLLAMLGRLRDVVAEVEHG